jgi:hypothetical protein
MQTFAAAGFAGDLASDETTLGFAFAVGEDGELGADLGCAREQRTEQSIPTEGSTVAAAITICATADATVTATSANK